MATDKTGTYRSGFDRIDRAEMALTLQETCIGFLRKSDEFSFTNFQDYLEENAGILKEELVEMIDETSGSYSQLVWSTGETPYHREPQDAADDLFRTTNEEELEMPDTWENLKRSGQNSVIHSAESATGSYS